MTTASELEKHLRDTPDLYVLKSNESGKSNVWKHFSLIFEKRSAAATNDDSKYFCVCVSCKRVYAYKAADGSSFGTKNLIDHIIHIKHTIVYR